MLNRLTMYVVVALSICCGVGLNVPASAAVSDETYPPAETERVLFLGDSITYAGHYVALVEARLRIARDGQVPVIINLGLPSETCTGLTEPGHPFPRPNVHERLDRALDRFRPDVVVVCYGMNDGIYAPFSADRFAAYQRGMNELIDKVTAAGAELVLLTPPPFDAVPVKQRGQLRDADSPPFGWQGVYANYDDEVIARYAQWILEQRPRVRMVIDVHTPLIEAVSKRRNDDPDYSLSPDGVHLDRAGHALVADAILDAWGYGGAEEIDPELAGLVEQRSTLLRDAWLSHVGHTRPGIAVGPPLDEANVKAAELNEQIKSLLAPK